MRASHRLSTTRAWRSTKTALLVCCHRAILPVACMQRQWHALLIRRYTSMWACRAVKPVLVICMILPYVVHMQMPGGKKGGTSVAPLAYLHQDMSMFNKTGNLCGMLVHADSALQVYVHICAPTLILLPGQHAFSQSLMFGFIAFVAKLFAAGITCCFDTRARKISLWPAILQRGMCCRHHLLS